MPRLLQADDVPAYRAIRLKMLRDAPWAFGSSPGDDRTESDGFFDEMLQDANRQIVVVDHPQTSSELACAVGVMRETSLKGKHLASIWGVFAVPEVRGQGVARSAMEHAIGVARSWDGVCRVSLSASARSLAAISLYKSLGFVQWGIEPGVTRVDGEDIDEVHMMLELES